MQLRLYFLNLLRKFVNLIHKSCLLSGEHYNNEDEII